MKRTSDFLILQHINF